MGKINEYDGSKEEWPQYVERLNHFFVANGITDAGKKKSVILSGIGPATYALARNLVAPEKPGDKSYDDLVALLTTHFNPTPSGTVQRFKIHSRFWKSGKTVATFVSELRSLSKFCNFGATLEEMWRDRLVCGISDDHIQRRLLAERTLTFTKALEIAQGLETAAKNVRELTKGASHEASQATVQEVHRVSPRRSWRNPACSSSSKTTIKYFW